MKMNFVDSKIKVALSCVIMLSILLFVPSVSSADRTNAVLLPPPQIQEGMSVMQALRQRKASRTFADASIPMAQLSDILWAANGINRPDTEGRTNPAALGVRSVEVYVVTADCIFCYEPKSHTLQPIATGDFRMATTTGQSFVGKAPLTLVYVSDSAIWQSARCVPPADKQAVFDSVAAGAMAQSVGLAAAAEGLGTCVRGSVDQETFGKAAHLREGQHVIIAQTIGVLP